MKKLVIVIILSAIIVGAFSSCNTLRGAGEDLRRGAEGVSNMFR